MWAQPGQHEFAHHIHQLAPSSAFLRREDNMPELWVATLFLPQAIGIGIPGRVGRVRIRVQRGKAST